MSEDRKNDGAIELAIGADGAKAHVDRGLLEFVFPGRVQRLNRIDVQHKFENATIDRINRKLDNGEPLTPDERFVLSLPYTHEAEKVENFVKVLERASTIRNALPPKSAPSPEPPPVHADWLLRFREGAQSFSDPVMQEVMARILNGEYERPGSFSMRTLAVVRDLDKDTAEIFAKLCRCVWSSGTLRLRLPSSMWAGYGKLGIGYVELLRADEAGLVDVRSNTALQSDVRGMFEILVSDWVVRGKGQPELEVHLLTTAGMELFAISDSRPSPDDAHSIVGWFVTRFSETHVARAEKVKGKDSVKWDLWKEGEPLP